MRNFKLLSNRLEWAIEQKLASLPAGSKISKRLIAQHAGVSAPAVNYWFADTNGIQAEAARNLAKFLEVDPVWLEKGEGDGPDTWPMRFEDRATVYRGVTVATPGDPNVTAIRKVRLRLSAGVTGFQTEPEFIDGSELLVSTEWLKRHGYDHEKLVAIRVKGDSMEPTLHEDDIVVINTSETKPLDGVVFALNYEGEAVVKRMVRDAGDWWLTSDSPDQRKHHRKVCRGDECIIVGRVVRKESDRI